MERRRSASAAFFGAEADRIARCCHALADAFATGGRLLASGDSPTDAAHIAVEFVHPVIVGKRALPALVLDPERAEPGDVVVVFADGAMTVGEWAFAPRTGDPFIDQELLELTYHVLWELVHVFLEHRGLASAPDAGRAAFLYPFLGGASSDLEALLADVRASVLMKARETQALRERIDLDAVAAAAAALRGRRVLAFGYGGSATDAADLVADLPGPALDLTAVPAILTAIANDIGPQAVFARQIIAYGRAGDVAVAFSTSGTSAGVLEGLAEARRRGLTTVALTGYDGGAIAREGLADHLFVVPCEHIPRIQEVHATISHLLVGA
jgi:D-sedoheptulose 7-phosphate isomerase